MLKLSFALLAYTSTAFATSVATPPSHEALCPRWVKPAKQGELDAKVVSESSGLVASKQTDLLYHLNDSGTGPEFHVSKTDGGSLTTVHIHDYKPVDPEDLSIGPCALKPSSSCLVIADTGDNGKKRKFINLVFIEENIPFAKSVKPNHVAYFKYPRSARNAEAVTVLDNGDVIIVTKEMSVLGLANPAIVYRAKRSDYRKATSPSEATELEKIGELNLPALNLQKGLGGIATGLASVANGSRFAVLTYTGAIEFSLDLKAAKLPSVITSGMYRLIPLLQLPQQESLTYDKNDRDLIYSTEIPKKFFGFGVSAPIYRVRCAL